jgi:HSP20 family protein
MNNSKSVFVVTDGITLTGGTTGTSTYTTGTTGLSTFTTSPLLFSSSGTGTVGIGLSNPSTRLDIFPPTYNDFWKFDEEFDLLWKSFFDPNALYRPIKEKAVSHPCDIQETDNGLCIEIAAVGLDKEELNIIVDSETLRVAYRKPTSEEEEEQNEYRYFQRSIKKASFDIAWKISSKFDLSKLEAKLDKGLLTLDIPFAKENKPKKVTIK